MQHSKYFSLVASSMVQGRSESPNTSFSSSLANSWIYHKFPKTRMVIIVFKIFNQRFIPDNQGEFPCNTRTKLQRRRLYHDPNLANKCQIFRLLRKQFSPTSNIKVSTSLRISMSVRSAPSFAAISIKSRKALRFSIDK